MEKDILFHQDNIQPPSSDDESKRKWWWVKAEAEKTLQRRAHEPRDEQSRSYEQNDAKIM